MTKLSKDKEKIIKDAKAKIKAPAKVKPLKVKNKNGRPKKKHAGGRPTVFTQDVFQKLEHAWLNGFTDTQACMFAGISMSSLNNYQNKNPEFLARKEFLKENLVLKAKQNMAHMVAMGDKDMTKFVLETKAKDEFSKKKTIEGQVDHNVRTVFITPEEQQACDDHIKNVTGVTGPDQGKDNL